MSSAVRLTCAAALLHMTGCSWFEADEGDARRDAAAGPGGRLEVPALAPGDQFGSAVAAWPDLLLIGAPGDDREGSEAGAVHVFTQAGSGWSEAGVLVGEGARAGDRFGASLALVGDELAVGAPGRDEDGGVSGAVFLYYRDGASWRPVASLRAPDGAAGARFGASVAFLDADRLAVGASGQDGESGGGATYLFQREGDGWVPLP